MRVFFSESPLIDNSIDYLRLDSHSKVVKVRKYGFETATYNQLTRKSCKNLAKILLKLVLFGLRSQSGRLIETVR